MAKVIAAGPDETPQWQSAPARFLSFLKDVRSEMKKVVSPSRKEVQSTTIVVIITVFFFAAYFAVVDAIIGRGMEAVLHKLTSH
jgi:preprotein translocase subunit SecE